MEKSFCIGLAFGVMAGVLLAVNSYKVRQFVKDSQKQVKDSVEKMAEQKEEKQNQTQE